MAKPILSRKPAVPDVRPLRDGGLDPRNVQNVLDALRKRTEASEEALIASYALIDGLTAKQAQLVRDAQAVQEAADRALAALRRRDREDAEGSVVGSVIAYLFDDTPAKYLELDGSSFSYDQYPLLGAKFSGSPGGMVALPDYTAVALWGVASGPMGSALRDVAGTDFIDLRHKTLPGNFMMPDHTHPITTGNAMTGMGATSSPANTDGSGELAITGDSEDIVWDNSDGRLDDPQLANLLPKRALVRWLVRAEV